MQEMCLTFVLGGALAASFLSSTKKYKDGIAQIGAVMNKLNAQKIDIKSFRELIKAKSFYSIKVFNILLTLSKYNNIRKTTPKKL